MHRPPYLSIKFFANRNSASTCAGAGGEVASRRRSTCSERYDNDMGLPDNSNQSAGG